MTGSANKARFKPMPPALMGCSFDRNDIEARNNGAATKRFVSGTVKVHTIDGAKFLLARCEFSAGEELESDRDETDQSSEDALPFFEVHAEYTIAVEVVGTASEKEDLVQFFTDLAAASAWPLFRTYFASVTAQALSDLPPLPILPDFIAASIEELEET